MSKQNVGAIDRVVRVLMGAVLLGVGITSLVGIAKVAVIVLGLIAFVTGAIGFCPLYTVLNISTAKKK